MLIQFYVFQQFFVEANDTNKALQKVHETLRKRFVCDKNTSLEDLQEILENLEVCLFSDVYQLEMKLFLI